MASTYIEIPSPTAGTAGVTSFTSRSGAVVGAAGDYTAIQVDYDNSGSGLTATDVQAAIDEIQAGVTLSTNNFVVTDGAGALDTLTDWSYSAFQGEDINSTLDATASPQVQHTRRLGANADGNTLLGSITAQSIILDLDPDNNGGSIGDTSNINSILNLEHITTGTATMENLVSLNITGTAANIDNFSGIVVGGDYTTNTQGSMKALEIRPTGSSKTGTGISVNMNNFTQDDAGTFPTSISTDGGFCSFSGSFPGIDDDKLESFFNIVPILNVENGTPLTQKDYIATLILPSLIFEDDFDAGPIGIGYVSTGFIFSIEGTAGKTVEKASAFVAAVSPQNNDGTITELNAIRIAYIPSGALTVTNFRAIAIEDGQASSGTNNWGLWIDDDEAENYLAKSLVIGASDTVTNASVGLELNATDRAVLLSRMDSTQRDALTEIAGMIIFNTTTNKFQGYDGTVWADLN